MKNTYPKKTESGQALVLTVIVLVVLLGFTAFAIDGGLALNDRRNDQSGADGAALAGGGEVSARMRQFTISYDDFGAQCTPGVTPPNYYGTATGNLLASMNFAQGRAIEFAGKNGFSLASNLSTLNGVETYCHNAYINPTIERYVDVKAMVTTTTESYFAQVFSTMPVKNTVTAVARVRPSGPIGSGYALVSLNNSCASGSGIELKGGGSGGGVNILNSGMFSNSCINRTGAFVEVSSTYNHYFDAFTDSGSGSITPTPVKAASKLPPMPNYSPNCAALGATKTFPATGGTINPGNYENKKYSLTGGDQPLTLNPGLYCFVNDFKATGSAMYGNGVTIYMQGGDFDLSGASTVTMTAVVPTDPPPSPASIHYAIPGLLLYSSPTYTGSVKITGGANNNWTGSVYIPNGTVEVGGNTGNVGTQIIAKDVKVAGSGTLTINFDSDKVPQVPGWLELVK